MNLYRPLHYICGEYVFTTEPQEFPRFSSLMKQNGFNFWGTRFADERVSFCVSLQSAERVSSLAQEAAVPLEMTSKKGIPFIFLASLTLDDKTTSPSMPVFVYHIK